jgi:flagellin
MPIYQMYRTIHNRSFRLKEEHDMVIQHNLQAMDASRLYGINSLNLMKSGEKLGSGYRINRAADDAAGLAISEKMRRPIRGLSQASVNCLDGVSLAQTADGAMNEVHDMLHRGTELSIHAANDTLTDDERDCIQRELDQILDGIEHIQSSCTFNEIHIFRKEGEEDKSILIQAGAEGSQDIEINRPKLDAQALEIDSVDVRNGPEAAKEAIDKFKHALTYVSEQRSQMGAYQNRLEHTINNLNNVVENTMSAESKIRDTNMAMEMVRYSTGKILMNSGYSVIAQANQSNLGVMKLLA